MRALLGLILLYATLLIGIAAMGSMTDAQFRMTLVIPGVILAAVIARFIVHSLLPYLITVLLLIGAGLGIAVGLFIISLL